MAWGSFLLVGDMGQQLDLGAQCEELARLRRSIARRQSKDLDQDARITALADENLNLKVSLAALVQMLVARGVFGDHEIANLVDALDAAEPGGLDGPPTEGPAGSAPPVAGTGLLALVRGADGAGGDDARPCGGGGGPAPGFKTSRNNGTRAAPSVDSRQRCLPLT